MQILRAQIPKALKIQSSRQSFFALLGSAHEKGACKMLVKLTLTAITRATTLS